ncbi:hypothetical protein [Neisseria weixii]|uniref:hypothetical protein n=1 Tax=Neisseria weixii TaxID=1853276 RepID=UPI00359FB6B9
MSDVQTGMGIVMAAIPKKSLEQQGAELYNGLTQTLLLGESQAMLSERADDLGFAAEQRD